MTQPNVLAYTIAEACAAARIGRTKLYALIKAGDVQAVKCGSRTLILVDPLQRFVSNLPPLHPGDANNTKPSAAQKYVRRRSRTRTMREHPKSNPTHRAAPYREGEA
jgi:excisionase family DNA binding protein